MNRRHFLSLLAAGSTASILAPSVAAAPLVQVFDGHACKMVPAARIQFLHGFRGPALDLGSLNGRIRGVFTADCVITAVRGPAT
ncbi:MAG: hypothetical protein WAT39_00100 [Planctomycetota bacterium]